jgi:N-acylglucosamine 2-epimerase
MDRAAKYRMELIDRIIPFWLDYAPDREFGGHFSCLTSTGQVYDTDKFIWMQSRLVWTFSRLANEPKLKLSESMSLMCQHEAEKGVSFLLTNGRNKDGDWFFSLDKKGNPLVAAYNIFSDVFALMGLAEYSCLTGNVDSKLQEHALIAAEKTWNRILQRQTNPKGFYNKAALCARQYRPMNWPMILLNLTQILEDTPLAERIGVDLLQSIRFQAFSDVLEYHLDIQGRVLRERINHDGSFNNENMEGRLLNPGHACETLAFMVNALQRDGSSLESYFKTRPKVLDKISEAGVDSAGMLISRAVEWNLTKGWDTVYGGIFYYLDALGLPIEKLEWDMKLWWVHLESSSAALGAYLQYDLKSLKDWFEKIDIYMWDKFRSSENLEWYGYLSRDGLSTHELSGSKWKGFFHLPRALMNMILMIETETENSRNWGNSENTV